MRTKEILKNQLSFLRKKGIAKASKKMDRTASDGLVLAKESNGEISIIEINSETDFVAKNENFINFCRTFSLNNSKKGDLEKLKNSKMSDGGIVKDNFRSFNS